MKQTSFASADYVSKKRQTSRARFLGEMNRVVPWSRLEALIEPHYRKSGKVGRPPIGVLRMCFLQHWCTLADEALEDALYDNRELLHGQETQVHGDIGYTGIEKRNEITTAQDEGRLR